MILNSVPAPRKRLYPADRFRFSCHQGLACFGTCCRNRDLTLTPYDVLRLKNALKLHSDEFLVRHTLYRIDPDSGFPIVSLKMGPDPERLCPFVTSDGCKVYMDRPTACRLFPLARASGFLLDCTVYDEFFFMLDAPKCLGRNEEETLSVKEWLAGQGVGLYRAANDKMLGLLFHPEHNRNKALSESQLQKIMVACYNLDVFRDFVFKTPFLDTYSIEESARSLIEKDDYELLLLAFSYLRTSLFP